MGPPYTVRCRSQSGTLWRSGARWDESCLVWHGMVWQSSRNRAPPLSVHLEGKPIPESGAWF